MERQKAIEALMRKLSALSSVHIEVVDSIVSRFSEECEGELVRNDFLDTDAFNYFSIRIAAHHASSSVPLKKENFEHILEAAFKRGRHAVIRTDSMTFRGADLSVDGVKLSLKTEASRGLKQKSITISKLMEAAWIKQITSREDIIPYLSRMVIPHFQGYERIFILRSYQNPTDSNKIRYDLREIPKVLLEKIGDLTPSQFSELTRTRTTSAEVTSNGVPAFKFRLDGSDDKITITDLSVALCPLHAWWSLRRPD